MKDRLSIFYDKEGDLLELRIGKPTESYFDELEDDIFERVDKKTGEIKGFSIFNFKKRAENLEDIDIDLPFKINLTS